MTAEKLLLYGAAAGFERLRFPMLLLGLLSMQNRFHDREVFGGGFCIARQRSAEYRLDRG